MNHIEKIETARKNAKTQKKYRGKNISGSFLLPFDHQNECAL